MGPTTSLSISRNGHAQYYFQSEPHTGSGGRTRKQEWDIPPEEAGRLLDDLVSGGLLELGHGRESKFPSHYFRVTAGGWQKAIVRPDNVPQAVWRQLLPLLIHADPEMWRADSQPDAPAPPAVRHGAPLSDGITGAWYDGQGNPYRVDGFDIDGRKYYVLARGTEPTSAPEVHAPDGTVCWPGFATPAGSLLEGTIFTSVHRRSMIICNCIPPDIHYQVNTSTPGKLIVAAVNVGGTLDPLSRTPGESLFDRAPRFELARVTSVLWGKAIDGLQAGIRCNISELAVGKSRFPEKPADLACFVRNTSTRRIAFAAAFGTRELSLVGQGAGHPHPSRLFAKLLRAQEYSLGPGEDTMIWHGKASEILVPDQQVWQWDWKAFPLGPRSPAYRPQSEDLEPFATMWLEVRLDCNPDGRSDRSVVSPRVRIAISRHHSVQQETAGRQSGPGG